MAAGRVVVACAETDTETAVLLREAAAGTCVTPESRAALTEAIHELSADPERSARFGQNGRQWIVDNYSLENVVETYDRIVRHVCTGRQ